MPDLRKLSGLERAAVLIGVLGEREAAEVMRHLDPKEIQQLGTTLATLRGVSKEDIEAVLDDFFKTLNSQVLFGIGSLEYLSTVLVKALGMDKANAILERIKLTETGPTGLDALRDKDPRMIADVLRLEHPQVVAIILSHLAPEQAGGVLAQLPEEVREDVMLRIALLDVVPELAMEELDKLIQEQFAEESSLGASHLGGTKTVANILNTLESSLQSRIMERIKSQDAKLAEQIEDQMFVFENLLDVDDRSIQRLLREVPSQTLALALKGADEAVREKIFKNMSKRASEMLREDLEMMGPVRLSEVEAAQKEILAIARRMAEAGELVLAGQGGDKFV